MGTRSNDIKEVFQLSYLRAQSPGPVPCIQRTLLPNPPYRGPHSFPQDIPWRPGHRPKSGLGP